MEKITRESGFRCASYKDKCLRRRIAVRMRAKGAYSANEYAGVLDADPREYARLLRSLTVYFFNDTPTTEIYTAIERNVIPELWDLSPEDLRIWSAGCA